MSDKESSSPVTYRAKPTLVITLDDFDTDARNKIRAAESGGRVLLGTDDATRELMNSLPGAISRRIRKIVPDEFVVAEIELRLALSGKFAGLELAGDVGVKLQPRKET